ncbi:DUF3558 domain-containing protein [Streptomyces sp. NBC_01618]|uniref:DUF3558 domain-containing protein n=1 Tax=Streptomyces sp. NBC_01618 TaxID=2975900 RepID=UPI00386CC9E5|nr:DUF3558 domain-containing protein [Streptomyces sp. NBC_01618]
MAYVPGTALLAALVVGCSASTGTGGSAPDSKPGEATAAAAAPGKYRTLLDACRTVPSSSLKDLLPGAADLPEDQQKKVYGGTATVTYDTDRRVGCRWKSEASDSSRTLFVDFERVVSYDPSVSDDDRAREVYAQKEAAAGLPADANTDAATPGSTKEQTSPSSDSASASEDKNADDPESNNADSNNSGTTDGGTADSADTSGSSGSSDQSLAPRTLDGLGDSAFLDDLPTRAGSTTQNRTVSVVFRTSNVIVTIQYAQHPTVSTVVPDSKELQEKAQSLARKLVEKFSE